MLARLSSIDASYHSHFVQIGVSGVHNITIASHDVSTRAGALGDVRTLGSLTRILMNLQCREGEGGMEDGGEYARKDTRRNCSRRLVCPGRWVNWASAGSRPVTGESGQACRNHARTRRCSRFTASCPYEDAGMRGGGLSLLYDRASKGAQKECLCLEGEAGGRKRSGRGGPLRWYKEKRRRERVWKGSDENGRSHNHEVGSVKAWMDWTGMVRYRPRRGWQLITRR